MRKKFLSLLIALCMMLGMLPMTAFALGEDTPAPVNDPETQIQPASNPTTPGSSSQSNQAAADAGVECSDSSCTHVAECDSKHFNTFDGAIAAAAAATDKSVTLLKDVTLTDNVTLPGALIIKKSLTLDGNGKTITGQTNDPNVHILIGEETSPTIDVKVQNLTVKNFGDDDSVASQSEWGVFQVRKSVKSFKANNVTAMGFNRGAFDIHDCNDFKIENCNINCTNGERTLYLIKGVVAWNSTGEINDTTITLANSTYLTEATGKWNAAAVEVYGNTTLNVNRCTLGTEEAKVLNGITVSVGPGTSTVTVTETNVVAKKRSLSMMPTYYGTDSHYESVNSTGESAATLKVMSGNYTGGLKMNGNSSFDTAHSDLANTKIETLVINDGTFTNKEGADAELIDSHTKHGKIKISGGTFNQGEGVLIASDDTADDTVITGGTFSDDPSKADNGGGGTKNHVVPGYAAVAGDGETYVVKEATIAFAPISSTEKVLTDSKTVSDLQTGITATPSKNGKTITVKGVAKEIDEAWTQFSGNSDENTGHFIALRMTKPDGFPAGAIAGATLKGSKEKTVSIFTEDSNKQETLVLRLDDVKAESAAADIKNKFTLTVPITGGDPASQTYTIDVSGVEFEDPTAAAIVATPEIKGTAATSTVEVLKIEGGEVKEDEPPVTSDEGIKDSVNQVADNNTTLTIDATKPKKGTVDASKITEATVTIPSNMVKAIDDIVATPSAPTDPSVSDVLINTLAGSVTVPAETMKTITESESAKTNGIALVMKATESGYKPEGAFNDSALKPVEVAFVELIDNKPDGKKIDVNSAITVGVDFTFTSRTTLSDVIGLFIKVVGDDEREDTVKPLSVAPNGDTNGDSSGNPIFRFTVKAPHLSTLYVVDAVPEGKEFTITASAESGGTISPSGNVSVTSGEDKTFTISANSGYKVADVTVDGASVGAVSSYTFESVHDNHTISATFTSTSSGGSSGGGSSSKATVQSATGGNTSISPASPKTGDTVTVTLKPTAGFKAGGVTVKDSKGNTIEVTKESDTKYTFVMPDGKVTITPTYVKDETVTPVQPTTPSFIDVQAGAYYADAVAWAVDNGITNGTSANTFSPDASCTRAQMVTFLWRAAGSPIPSSTANPFNDVKSDQYYMSAVQWAVEKGITTGTSANTFSPDATVSRGQTVTFLYRFAGSPEASGSSSFSDVPANQYYANAVKWAVDEGITNGTSANTFSPVNDCTRGQIVTFLYRDLAA